MEPISLNEIAKACNGVLSDNIAGNTIVENITIDSRMATNGCLYIPVKGEVYDGHAFIASAFENGAVCTLTEKAVDYPHIRVESTFQALKDIAEYYRSQFDIKVVAITGSVGKTTAKDMIASVLSQGFNVLKTEGNYNNEFGLPQMLFKLDKTHEVAVLEMGMNSFGEISRLSKTARPDVCVIINIGVSHIGRLGSRDGILKAKSEIFDYMKKDGKVYLCGDDDKLITLKDKPYHPIYFGENHNSQARVLGILSADIKGTRFRAHYNKKDYNLFIPVPGKHLIPSALAAVAIAQDMGMEKNAIEAGVHAFAPSKMRMDIIETEKLVILNDVYNACPESILAGMDVLNYGKERKVAILGDILELDDFAEDIHYQCGVDAANKQPDMMICVGPLSRAMAEGAKTILGEQVMYYKTQDDMMPELKKWIQPGDTVLVKASRGLKLENTVNYLKQNF